MSTEIVKPEAEADYFVTYGETATPRTWLGDLMRFSKFGEYIAGIEGAEIESGTSLIALMSHLEVGWQCWRDSRPAGQRMGRIAQGFVPPRRAELGDLDKSTWEKFEDGREKDPWTFSNSLPLADADGRLFTFVTSSKGGLSAVGELSKAYGRHLRQSPDELPIVSLGVRSYQHSNRSFGEIRYPVFEVTGWTQLPKKIAEAIGATMTNEAAGTATASITSQVKPAMKPAGTKSRVEAAKPTSGTAKKKAGGMKF
jgi:hypothetical protein